MIKITQCITSEVSEAPQIQSLYLEYERGTKNLLRLSLILVTVYIK